MLIKTNYKKSKVAHIMYNVYIVNCTLYIIHSYFISVHSGLPTSLKINKFSAAGHHLYNKKD